MKQEHARSSGSQGHAAGAGAHELGMPQTAPPRFPSGGVVVGFVAGALASLGVGALRRAWKSRRAPRVPTT